MVVRIRFGRGPSVRRGRGKNRRVAWAAGALLTPAAAMAFALAAWRICSDLGWAREFAFSEGFLSHWQVWLALSALLEFCAWTLNRYGQGAGAPPEAVSEPVAARRSAGDPSGRIR
jgi:hypothetical protein